MKTIPGSGEAAGPSYGLSRKGKRNSTTGDTEFKRSFDFLRIQLRASAVFLRDVILKTTIQTLGGVAVSVPTDVNFGKIRKIFFCT